MRHKYIKYFAITLFTLFCGLFCGCSEWTEVESIDLETTRPEEQDPALWAKYMAALKSYKSSGHLIAYATFSNGVEIPVSEKDFLRSLPDSLDIVSLNNGDNISAYDLEDIKVLQSKSTRVLYRIDYAGRAEEFATIEALGTYIDKVIAKVADIDLDGFSFTGLSILGDETQKAAAKLLIDKLSVIAGDGKDKLLVFEGNPLFIPSDQMTKINYCVLNSQDTSNITDFKMQLMDALDNAKVPRAKLLISAGIGNEIADATGALSTTIKAMSEYIFSMGPVAGLGIYNISYDYAAIKGAYYQSRTAIQAMNPSPTK